MKYFINLSGGIDSTFYLWKLFNEFPEEKVLIHHCLLFESRKTVEQNASRNIIEYFKKQNKNFLYKESRFKRTGIPGTLFDIEIVYFMAGLILKSYPTIENIYIPICKEELDSSFSKHLHQNNGSWSNYNTQKSRFFKAMSYTNIAAGKNFNFSTPYFNVSKEEMITQMPEELFNLTWWCRTPINNKPCNDCFNCRRVNKILNKQ